MKELDQAFLGYTQDQACRASSQGTKSLHLSSVRDCVLGKFDTQQGPMANPSRFLSHKSRTLHSGQGRSYSSG